MRDYWWCANCGWPIGKLIRLAFGCVASLLGHLVCRIHWFMLEKTGSREERLTKDLDSHLLVESGYERDMRVALIFFFCDED